jgi:hypothetical protein
MKEASSEKGLNMKRIHVVAGLVASLTVGLPISAAVAQGGAPTQAIVQHMLLETFDPGGPSKGFRMDFHAVVISPGHKASAHEGMYYQVSLGQMIYPVRAAWTSTAGTGPSAYVRDYDTHYFAFQSAQKKGAWDLTGDPQRGDKNGVLRGG